MTQAESLVRELRLSPHPEGGFFRETYRASEGASTAIYFLLPAGARSRLHRIRSDEMWHFYLGGPLEIVEIAPDGRPLRTILGSDLGAGQMPQHVVPAGRWFGARPMPGSAFSLVGCTVAPAFDFSELELGEKSGLLADFPRAKEEIEALCP